ncbi:hypothetical protein HYT60_01685, partial [Candidatus Woesebacteria bacterium]|nr:hypothetical protein [Candidatus Woesebacteria bacterium]
MKELIISFAVRPDDSRITTLPQKTQEFVEGMEEILESASETVDLVFGEEYSRTKYLATDYEGSANRLVRGLFLALVEKSEKSLSKAVVVGVNAVRDIAVFSYATQAHIKTSSPQWKENFQKALQEALENPGEYYSEEYYQSYGDFSHLPTI